MMDSAGPANHQPLEETHARIHPGNHYCPLLVLGGAYFYATTGHFDTRAVGNTPSTFERRTANKSVDAWVDDHAPKQANPFQPTMDNVMDGSMTYDKNCAFCHGSLKEPISPMQNEVLSVRAPADEPHAGRS